MNDPAKNIRAAFREVALGAFDFTDELARLGPEVKYAPSTWRIDRHVYRPRGKQETPEYVEPFDVDADWEERA